MHIQDMTRNVKKKITISMKQHEKDNNNFKEINKSKNKKKNEENKVKMRQESYVFCSES